MEPSDHSYLDAARGSSFGQHTPHCPSSPHFHPFYGIALMVRAAFSRSRVLEEGEASSKGLFAGNSYFCVSLRVASLYSLRTDHEIFENNQKLLRTQIGDAILCLNHGHL